MVAKKKLLGLAVVLGFILGGTIALVRAPKREAVVVVESVLTNVVEQPVATNVAPKIDVAKPVKVNKGMLNPHPSFLVPRLSSPTLLARASRS